MTSVAHARIRRDALDPIVAKLLARGLPSPYEVDRLAAARARADARSSIAIL